MNPNSPLLSGYEQLAEELGCVVVVRLLLVAVEVIIIIIIIISSISIISILIKWQE